MLLQPGVRAPQAAPRATRGESKGFLVPPTAPAAGDAKALGRAPACGAMSLALGVDPAA